MGSPSGIDHKLLGQLVAQLDGYRLQGDSIWRGLVQQQIALIQRHWSDGTLVESVITSAIGTAGGGGHCDPNYIPRQFEAYAERHKTDVPAILRALHPAPDPDHGKARDKAMEFEGHWFSERHLWGWHYGKMILALQAEHGGPVCEVGGGVGYAAYYARRTGVREWIGIDLLPSLIHQYIILARHYPVRVNQPYEPTAIHLYDALEEYDDWLPATIPVWVNTDSLTEMTRDGTVEYIQLAAYRQARVFYSVNAPHGNLVPHDLFGTQGWSLGYDQPFPRMDSGTPRYREQIFLTDP